MQRFAWSLDKPQDVQDYCNLSLKIKDAFNKKFLNPKTNKYSNNTVTANILPLSFGMVPNGLEQTVFNNIIDKTEKENKGHISTGVIGTQWLMRGLTKNGRPDLAYKLATNRSYPSWGYMLENGATTIWELWNGNTADPGMNSGNHVMLLGDLLVWFYENLGGIKSDTTMTGFKKIIMNPYFIDDLKFVNASYHSVHGMIKSHWKKELQQLRWNITIPANTTAIVSLPADEVSRIKENGKNISTVEEVRFLKKDEGGLLFEIGSGNYAFTIDNYNSHKKTASVK
jgi:alpha-L-rhamnosidase